ncbi:MFS transporter [Lacticaseibacillus thailandensis]|nr:MFS transporter [Lacticaseibacillus thailandensis]
MSRPTRRAIIMLTTGILLIGANLRLPITMMPPMLDSVRRAAGLPTSLAGLLTTIPLLMFAVISPVVAQLGIRRGNGQTLLLTMAILVVGSYLRIITGAWALLLGTALVGIGIAGGNVLLPALIKEKFPDRIGPLTAVYSTTMSIVASLATAFAGVMSLHMGSRATMALLSLVSIVA